MIYEKFQEFSREVSLVGRALGGAARSCSIRCPANTHGGRHLALRHCTFYKCARWSAARGRYMKRVMNALDYVGVLTIEFFVVQGSLDRQ